METVDQAKFSCQACGKSYKWKPELAGKKVKFKCGAVMLAPQQPGAAKLAAVGAGAAKAAAPKAAAPKAPAPAPADDDLDGLYALAADEKRSAKAQTEEVVGFRCPSCQADMVPGDVMCASCGFNIRTNSRGPAAAHEHPQRYETECADDAGGVVNGAREWA